MIPISYNVRSLVVRKRTTFAAAFGLALVVWVFASAQMLSTGLQKTFGRNASANVAVVLRKGSANELQSTIEDKDVSLALAHAEQLGAPKPAGVGEVFLVVILDRIGGGSSNVPIRGITEGSLKLRPTAKIIEGVAPKPASDEVLVGAAIRGRFKGLQLGQTFELKKNRPVKVVGVFSDGGSAYESEVWADRDTVRQAFGRDGYVSSLRVLLDKPGSFLTYKTLIESDKQLGLSVMTEPKFLAKQSASTAGVLGFVGNLVSFFFAIGAMIGATITMNAQVAGRTKEIGTLRALGFSRFGILTSFLLESMVLGLAGGVVGALASLAMVTVKLTMVNAGTWSLIVFGFEPTLEIIVTSVIVAVVMGLVGGFLPAIRAARVSPVAAMRE